MSKEIKFNIKLSVDGKEQLVTASTLVEDLRKNIDKAKRTTDHLRGAFVMLNQSAELVKSLSDILDSSTKEYRTFSSAMNAANTMAGKGSEDFEKLKDQVSELSKTIPLTRDALANGLYQVISNGVPEDNWLEYLNKSARASVGGIADLGETVKVTSTIIKNYGLAWEDAEAVQDKIQLTAKNGVTSFEQLAQALPRVTGNAATLGVSIDELLASFATLTGVSGNTSEVATQLAAIFTALVKPSSEAGKMAAEMGIQFNAASIKAAGGLRSFLQQLDAAVKQYSAANGLLEQEVYGKLFGSAESLRALIPLTNQLAGKFDENVDNMVDSAGTISGAFDTMSNSAEASFQKMKNYFAGMTDSLSNILTVITPYLNFGSQLGMTIISVVTLTDACRKLNAAQSLMRVSVLRNIAAYSLFATNTQKAAKAVRVMSLSFRSAATRAVALKIAMRGLMIGSVVGVALIALGTIITRLVGSMDDAKTSAEDAADGLNELDEAADNVKTAYESTLKNTYADLMSQYENLKNAWVALSTEQQKIAWINNNQHAFKELRIKIGNVTDAENIFNRKTDAVVEAFKQRAMAAAYAAKLTALYGRQISLMDEKRDLTSKIAEDAKKNGRNAKQGDIIPEGWRQERYGNVGYDGKWRFTELGAKRYNGTDVSGNTQITDLDRQLAEVDTEIDATKKTLEGRLKSANNSVISFGNGNGSGAGVITPTQAPKTYVDKLRAQLSDAQKELDNALTVEARVQADAKIKDIQAQIDEATRGKVSIAADIEPGYIEPGSKADKRASNANAAQRIDRIQQDYEIGIIGKDEALSAIADINKQLEALGLKPIEVQFATRLDELHEQLRAAQYEFDNALTIDAKVQADARISDIQAQIDEATRGRLTIEAETAPEYVTKGSTEDIRQSYANAQSQASRIQTDYEIGIIGKEEAEQQIAEINKQIASLGDNIKPLKLSVQTEDIDAARQKMMAASDAVYAMGSSLSGLGSTLKVPELNIAGTIAQAIATMTQGYATATAQAAKMGPWAWIAFAATGMTQLLALISSVKQAQGYATGGIVGGTSTSGDKKIVRVNSGEMILNKSQQAQLFRQINSGFVPPVFTERRMPSVVMGGMDAGVQPASTVVNITMNAKARKMLEVLADEKRVVSKSGRKV